MIKEKAQLLVEALRGGKYKQGKYYLNIDNKEFSCLGVACEVSMKELGLKTTKPFKDREDNTIEYNDVYINLPLEVRDYFGFDSCLGERIDEDYVKIDGKIYKSLADANDKGCTFNQIADYIEKEYKNL